METHELCLKRTSGGPDSQKNEIFHYFLKYWFLIVLKRLHYFLGIFLSEKSTIAHSSYCFPLAEEVVSVTGNLLGKSKMLLAVYSVFSSPDQQTQWPKHLPLQVFCCTGCSLLDFFHFSLLEPVIPQYSRSGLTDGLTDGEHRPTPVFILLAALLLVKSSVQSSSSVQFASDHHANPSCSIYCSCG